MSTRGVVEGWYRDARPWVVRRSDEGLHGTHEPDGLRPYWMFFTFLRLSPSYELSRQVIDEAAPIPANAPADFERVLDTFRLLGDVSKTFFTVWWRQRAAGVFGTTSDFDWTAKPPLTLTRRAEQQSLRRYAETMMYHAANQAGYLRFRQGKPANWRIAAFADPKNAHAKAVDAAGGTYTKTAADSHRHLNWTFVRDLRSGEAIAESAARGRFPLAKVKPQVKFDYAAIGVRLAGIANWEASQRRKPVVAR